jgi:hypothetical protein
MKQRAKLISGVMVVAAVLFLALIPVVPIGVAPSCHKSLVCLPIILPASASVTYAYLGFGAVQVPNVLGGHAYCFTSWGSGSICGLPWVRG